MASLISNPDDLLELRREQQGKLLLKLLAEQHTSPQTAVSHANFFSRAHDSLAPPKYGHRQAEVDEALREAWTWVESQGLLTRSPSSAGNWVYVGKAGTEFLNGDARPPASTSMPVPSSRRPSDPIPESLDDLELDVAHWMGQLDDSYTSPGSLREGAIKNRLLRLDHAKRQLLLETKAQSSTSTNEFSLIADSRLDELRALTSPQFDFRKLIRLCEELNTAYQQECYFATAMLTRAVLDHVPPIFGKQEFDEVASNYGGKSFKGTMHHLQNASRNVADGHLHQQVRKTETLPTAQQVNCGQQLDVLLQEIVRVTREKGPTP